MIGSTVSHYSILRELGRGGMGVVYEAEDLRLRRHVALKFLPAGITQDEEAKQRFILEAQAASALDHPNVYTVHEIDETPDGRLFIAMVCYQGETLKSRLSRGRLSVDEALDVVTQAARGLACAHEAGIVHRDIKPANLMLTSRGEVKILDFGVAKLSAGQGLTRTGTAVGTPAYMSPEQLQGKEVDQRADIWSLGIVLYEMLAGHPFQGADELIASAIVTTEPKPLRAVRDDVPDEVARIAARALEKRPEARYASVGELLSDLTRCRAALDGSGAVPRPGRTAVRKKWAIAVPVVALLLILGVVFFRDGDANWFQEVAIPAIESNIAAGNWVAAFEMAEQAQRRLGENPALDEIWPRVSWTTTIDSEPRGATAYLRAYEDDKGEWRELGRTPLEGIRIPLGLSRLRLELDGHLPLFRTVGGGVPARELRPRGDSVSGWLIGPETYRLDTKATLPEGKVRVPGWTEVIKGETVMFGDYFLDRTEVTNAQFKAFVDAGGYDRSDLWEPIVRDGKVVPWKEAMKLFVDRTGQRGPGTWSAGDFPLGEEEFPVAGVSWYEAAAYARFVGQDLPTAYHWRRARAEGEVPWLMAASNLATTGPRAVTQSAAMSFVGAYDMAGNVREWTASPSGDGRIIAGGSWDDEPYVAFQGLVSMAPPLDRSSANGFRLAIIRDRSETRERSFTPIVQNRLPPDALPVGDDTFKAYASFFAYERKPLNASLDSESETRQWKRQRITFDSPYGAGRVILHLYLPAAGVPPYQTVLYWPGASAYLIDSIDDDPVLLPDFIARSGRALAIPVYAGTYERRNDRGAPFAPRSQIAYRDNVIEGVIDLRRSLDYLETRSDIDPGAFAYFGLSQGGVNAPIVLAQEPRLRAAVSYVGFIPSPPPPIKLEPMANPLHALPWVRVPLLLLSGEFDSTAPLENAQRYFELLGTPAADKKHVIAPGGHFVPRERLIQETLGWLDRYLGPPRKR